MTIFPDISKKTVENQPTGTSESSSNIKIDSEKAKVQQVAQPTITAAPITQETKKSQKSEIIETSQSSPLKGEEWEEESDDSYSKKYGNKALNLFKLQKICSSIFEEEGIKVQVPQFQGISHSDVSQCLEILYPDFKKDWKEFLVLQDRAHQQGIEGLSPESKNQLNQIHVNIKEAFISPSEKAFANIKSTNDQINRFLFGIKDPVMVRSTGREDSDELALAGGNESVAGVKPEVRAILQSMGTVVASYFSEKSFSQRLLAKQDIMQDPFMPVLLQVMIGEKPGAKTADDEVLGCGVGYTRELGGETPHLTVLQAAYGLNDAVVNSLLPTDTYYVYPDGMSHEIILPKPERIVAQTAKTGNSNLKKVPNSFKLANKPVLTPELQLKLQKICKRVQTVYGKPMDIEWVYDPAKETFYIVQARPLVIKKIITKPSITDKTYLQEKGTIHIGEMIVHLNGQTIILKKPEEVIVAKDLRAALKNYLTVEKECKLLKQKNPVKAVIVEKMGNSLSHHACVFRENGIPVICSAGFEKTNLDKKNTIALIDSQRGYVAQLADPSFVDHSSQEIQEELLKKGLLKEGWYKHPLAAKESLKDVEVSAEYLEELYKSLALEENRSGKQELEGFTVQEKPGPQKLDALNSTLEMLNSKDIKKGDQAVKDLIILLYKMVLSFNKSKDSLGNNLLLKRTKDILLNAMLIGKDYLKKDDPMQRLHAAKRLEALLYQDATLRILKSDSIRAVLEEKKLSKSIELPKSTLSSSSQANLKELEQHYMQAFKKETEKNFLNILSNPMSPDEIYTCVMTYQTVKVLAFSKEAQENWKTFTDSIVSSNSRIANRLLLNLIQEMEEMGVLGEWLNDQFMASYQKKKDPIHLLQLLTSELKAIKKFQKEIVKLNTDIKSWENNIKNFEDPHKFAENWKNLNEKVVQPLEEFSKEYPQKKLTPFQKRVFLHCMLNGIDVFDKCIKTVRGNPGGNVPQKVTNFYMMLKPYKNLMTLWFNAIPEKNFNRWHSNNIKTYDMDPKEYRQKALQNIIGDFDTLNDFSEKQLSPTSDFNVQAHCVNSGVDMAKSEPPSNLEEWFQTFHQNILASIACQKESLPLNFLPDPLQPLLGTLETLETEAPFLGIKLELKTEKLNQEIIYPHIITTYNIPVKHHSVVINVIYDCVKKEASLQLNMLGHNLNNRMDHIAISVLFRSLIHRIQFKDYPAYDEKSKVLQFTWKFSEEMLNNLPAENIQKVLVQALKDSLYGTRGDIIIPSVTDMEKQQPKLWEDIANNPQSLTHLYQGIHKAEAIEIITQMIKSSPNHAVMLLQKLGIPILKKEEKDILRSISSGFVNFLMKDTTDGRVANAGEKNVIDGVFYKEKNPNSFGKGIILGCLKNLEKESGDLLWDEILNNRQVLLYSHEQNFNQIAFYPLLAAQLVKYLQANKKFDEISDCANFLLKNKQYESLLPFYKALKTDKNRSHQAEQILQSLKAHGVPGTAATKEIFEHAQELKGAVKIKSGAPVIFSSKSLGGYFYGKILKMTIPDKKYPDRKFIVVKCGGEEMPDELHLSPRDVRLYTPIAETGITITLSQNVDQTAKKVSNVNI